MSHKLEIVTAIIVIITLLSVKHALRAHHPFSLVHRWLTGHTYHGMHFTNATWFRKGDKCLHPLGRCHRWHYLPRIHRAGIRTGSTVAFIFLVYGIFAARGDTYLALFLAGLASLIGGSAYGIYRGRRAWNNRVTVNPLAAALAPFIGIPAVQMQAAIKLPLTYLTQRTGELGRIEFPPEFAALPGQREPINSLLEARLPVDIEPVWHTSASPQYVAINAAPRPPAAVDFFACQQYLDACSETQLFQGLDRNHEPYVIDLDTESPHLGASVRSGRGKSSWLQMTAAQVLRKNKLATVTGIDPKQASLENLAGIPGVTLCSDPADIPAMWEAIRAFRAEMEGRLAQLKRDPTICFPVKLLLLDELAQFMAMSRAIWRASKTAKDPGIPPVVQDIASVFWLGRAARCFGLVVAQKLDDRSLGNMGLRECLGAIALGGFRPNAYRMITGNYQAPKPQKGRGRWLWINDDQETWVQVAYGDPIKLRDYAMVNRLPMTQPVDRKTAA